MLRDRPGNREIALEWGAVVEYRGGNYPTGQLGLCGYIGDYLGPPEAEMRLEALRPRGRYPHGDPWGREWLWPGRDGIALDDAPLSLDQES